MKEAIDAYQAKSKISLCTEEQRNKALLAISDALLKHQNEIINQNELDLEQAKKMNLSSAMIDRLKLDSDRIQTMASSVKNIAKQDQVVGEVTQRLKRADGLIITKERTPIGVIGMIFESRPNVVIDSSALAIKSGNCIILKGGKEAANSNEILFEIIRDAITPHLAPSCIQMLFNRSDVSELLKQTSYVDLIIPRGGEGLIQYVCENSKVPVLAHFKGLCHVFIDESANLSDALEMAINAKTHRTGVCNAMETLLIHKSIKKDFLIKLFKKFSDHKTKLRLSEELYNQFPQYEKADKLDWDTEYLENILSVRLVNDIQEALTHIQKHGSHHTEAIFSENEDNIDLFKRAVDASSIMVNASTRFNDGGEYGLGAELGISTSKIHAYGPMGAKEMTIERFVVYGKGHIRK